MRATCPCCGYTTLSRRAADDICQVCYWHDDGQDDPEADLERGGPNRLSLTAARINFLRLGASEERLLPHVRRPREDEERLRLFELKGDSLVERQS